MHRRVGLGVDDDGVALANQNRQGSQVPEGGRRWHDHVGMKYPPEPLLELGVEPDRGVGGRRREHRPEPVDGILGGGLESWIGVEPQVGAGAEIHQSPATDGNPRPIEVVVLDPDARETAILRRSKVSLEERE